ncbi:MAG: DUF3168 domain-containing protein [Hyphomicrobiaceae bacterium]
MTTAGWALQVAIHQVLVSDAALGAELGGGRVYDYVPRGASYPYVTFGQTAENDWSSGSDQGSEHLITLHVWDDGRGRRTAHRIVARVRGLLHDATLSLQGHRLINLRHEFTDVRREGDGQTIRALVRFRAVTEPT